jgi:hypothetical protein
MRARLVPEALKEQRGKISARRKKYEVKEPLVKSIANLTSILD